MINTEIFLISETYVKKASSIMKNVDNQFIKAHILEAQNIQIQQVLGTALYDEIIEEFISFKASGDPRTAIGTYVSATNLTLIDNYLKQIILYYTLYYSIYDLWLKFTNKGVVNQTSDNSDTADILYLEKMRKSYKSTAEDYIQLMLDFLIENSSSYPLFITNEEDCNTLASRSTSTMYLGKNI